MADPDSLLIKGTYNTLYNALTRPDRKFVVTHYFLDEWLPILGPSLSWLVITLRQRCFWNQRSDWCIVNKTTLAQETAMEERTIERCFKKPYSDWFILDVAHRYRYRTDLGKKVRDKNRYHLLLDEPLSPRHQLGLAALLGDLLSNTTDPLQAGLDAVQALLTMTDLTDKISYEGDIAADLPRYTILELVEQALGIDLFDHAADPRVSLLDQRCAELYNKIVQPNRIYVGWQYFRLNWLEHLGQSLAWVIIYLRRRCFWDEASGELRDECVLFKKDLAAAIGQTPRNLANLIENPYASLFFTPIDDTKKGPTRYRVRLVDEPLTPADQNNVSEELKRRLQGEAFGQDVEDGQLNLFPIIDRASNRQNFAYGQVAEEMPDRSAKKSRVGEDQPENLSGRKRQKSRVDEEASEDLSDWWQKKSRSDELEAEDLSDRRRQKSRVDRTETEKMSQHADPEGGKNVATLKDSIILLESKKKQRQNPKKAAAELDTLAKELDELSIQEPARQQLLADSELTSLEVRAWLLYAGTQPGLKHPKRYVISRLLRGDQPPLEFVQLAGVDQVTWDLFERISQTLVSGQPSQDRIPAELQETFLNWIEIYYGLDAELLRTMVVLEPPLVGESTRTETVDHEADQGQQVWTLTLDQLQLKMTKSAFNSWLRQSYPLSFEQGKLIVAVQNDYAKEWLENRWTGMIERVLADVIGESIRIEFTVERHLKASTG